MSTKLRVSNQGPTLNGDSKTLAPVVGERIQLFQDFLKLMNEICSQKTYLGVNNIIGQAITLKQQVDQQTDEIQRLQAEVLSEQTDSRRYVDDLKTNHAEAIKDLVKSCNSVTSDEKQQCQELQVQLGRNEAALEREKQSIAEMRVSMDELKQRHETLALQKNEVTQRLAAAEEKIRLLEGKVRISEETSETQREKLKSQGSIISRLKSSVKTAEDEKTSLSRDLDMATRKLLKIEGYSRPLTKDDAKVDSAQLHQLWRACLRATTTCFEQDLEESVLNDEHAWSKFTSSPYHTHANLIPHSNSKEAKQMCTVVLLATLSSYLTNFVFTASYLPKGNAEYSGLMMSIAEKDPSKERFCRGLMLSTIDNDTQQLQRQKIAKITAEVVTLVHGLVGETRALNFTQELQAIITNAAEMWHAFEARESHFAATMDVDAQEWDWRTVRLDRSGIQLAEQSVKPLDFVGDDVVSAIFPRVYTIDGARDVPIFPGVILQKSQTKAVSREVVAINNSRGMHGKASDRRKLSSQQGFTVLPLPGSFLA